MSNTVKYAGNQGSNTPNTDSRPSPFLWKDCPWDEIVNGFVEGFSFYDTFLAPYLTVPTTQGVYPPFYKAFTSTGGTILPTTPEVGGVLMLSSDGDDEGASIGTVGLPIQISRSHGKFWFEARIKTSTIADTKHGIFLGLADQLTLSATVPIAADGTLADENFVGFHRLEGDGDYFNTVYKADGVTQVTVKDNAQVIVADTYLKLGMKFDPADFYLRFYGNGIELADKKLIPSAAGTDFPNDVLMGPVLAVLNATATTPGNTIIDWWRYAYTAP